ncbi:MAG: endonuclease III [Hymenobacteraceae bacterium]|nr:endonuclease III [Hymenobacteraceae bacterium]
MKTADRYAHLLARFAAAQPDPETELRYNSPYELLVAVVLAAQCTDKRINQIPPALFALFPTPAALAAASVEDIYQQIRSVSYPNNKAKHLAGLGARLMSEFGAEVPATVEALQTLPGVGRKTANVIASVIFNQPTMAVDTHVFRVSHRLGLVPARAKTPLAVELELLRHIPTFQVSKAHHWLILHGRYVCVARKPKCAECPLTDICRYYELAQRKAVRVAGLVPLTSAPVFPPTA